MKTILKELFLYLIAGRFELVKREFKHLRQKLFLGYSDSESWCLYLHLSYWLLPRLKHFKVVKIGRPTCLKTEEEWDKILDKIIFSLEFIVAEEQGKLEKLGFCWKRDAKKVQEGTELLGLYLRDLWW